MSQNSFSELQSYNLINLGEKGQRSLFSASDFTLSLPYSLHDSAATRRIDELAIASGIPGISLMKAAARSALAYLLSLSTTSQGIAVFCGKGNNAGDGYILAALAQLKGISTIVFAVEAPSNLEGTALKAYQFARDSGVEIHGQANPETIDSTLNTKFNAVSSRESSLSGLCIVDALLGTGISGDVREPFNSVILWLNKRRNFVFSLDIPSGLCATTGNAMGAAVQADATITFITLKPGLLTAVGVNNVGQLAYSSLGVSDSIISKIPANVQRIDFDFCKPFRISRKPSDHKGVFGRLTIVGGDEGFGGAVIMAAESATRVGVGTISVVTHEDHITAMLSRLPEVMVREFASLEETKKTMAVSQSMVIGPGLGRSSRACDLLRVAMSLTLPMVIDADALNCIAGDETLLSHLSSQWVFTPHPGEAARLLGITTEDVNFDRIIAAKKLQKKLGGVVVLKGAGSIIATAEKCYLANVGSPCMATGGTGDVLSGIIGGFLAQGMNAEKAACLAVTLHGRAAELAESQFGRVGIRATDIIPFVRALLSSQE